MKLLFVYRFCGLGGVETSVLNRVKALQGIGVEVEVLFSEYYGIGGSSIANHPRVTFGLQENEVIDFLHRGFDVIFVIDYPEFIDVIEGAQIRSKLLFESHCAFPPALKHFHRKLDSSRIAGIVVPSRFNQRLVEESISTTKDFFVIPNPINTEVFYLRPLHSLKQRFQGLLNAPVIAWVGRLENEKNPLEFLTLAEALLRVRPTLHFLVVGDTPNYD